MIKIDMNFLQNNYLVKYFGKGGLRSSLKIFFYFFKAGLRLTTLETGIILKRGITAGSLQMAV